MLIAVDHCIDEMEDSQVLRNKNSQTAEKRSTLADPKSLQKGLQNAPFCTSRPKAVFMSPTDSFFSPCTQKLASRKGPHHPSLMALGQWRLGKAFQQETKEN